MNNIEITTISTKTNNQPIADLNIGTPAVYPSVVIIGRPNVGKSTLFNKLTKTRKAIVGDEPGITRDRHYGIVEWQNHAFEIIDTGGIIPDEEAIIPANIFKQAQIAIDTASLILWMVDARAGITPLDQEIAPLMHQTGKPVFIVANKAESPNVTIAAQELYKFGFDNVYPISSEHSIGLGELLDDIVNCIKAPAKEDLKTKELRIAIVGRPNVGKSSLVNCLLGEERVIVSPIAGTTRDSIDTLLTHNEQNFRLVDTAGIRRKGKTKEMAEKLSVVMARKALERADIAIVLIDAVEGPTALDATIAGYVHEAGTSVIIAVNKWDLLKKDSKTLKNSENFIREKMKFLDYAPIFFISALTGQRVSNLLEASVKAYQSRNIRISTGQLNRFFTKALENSRATTPVGSHTKVLYLTQARTHPPTFVLFTNSKKPKLHFAYERYVINQLRSEFDFFATPIRIVHQPRKTN